MDSFIKWMGGKSSMRELIIPMIPPHKTYIEPFGGAGWIFLGKPRSPVEIFNDINGNLINLWKTVKVYPDLLKELLENHPISESIFSEYAISLGYTCSREIPDPSGIPFLQESFGIPSKDLNIRKAAMYYYLVKMAFNGMVLEGVSFAVYPGRKPPFLTFYETDWNAISERLKEVLILNRDFEEVINGNDSETSFFYLDPPYLMDNSKKYYAYTFDGSQDHDRLKRILEGIKGKFILSYRSGDHGRELYSDFHIQEYGPELLISNFKPESKAFYRQSKPTQSTKGNWIFPNCPECGSRDIQQLYKRVTYENKKRNWKPKGFLCNDCGVVYH